MDRTVREVEKPESHRDAFDVLFIGLVCFLKDARLVLLPDGRRPQPQGVTPHTPVLVVHPTSIVGATGWETGDRVSIERMKRGLFELPKCELKITGASTPGTVNAAQHDRFVPKLRDADPSFVIDPDKANAVVRFRIGRGTLEALRTPDSEPDDEDVAIISRLRVEHQDPITVEVWEEEQRQPRTLLLNPLTDIAIANIAIDDDGQGSEHFSIYGQLTVRRKIAGPPPRSAPRVDRLNPDHHIFSYGIPVQDGGSACGTQGCCPP